MSWLTKIDLKLLAWIEAGTKPKKAGRHRANGLSTMQKIQIRHEAVRRVQSGLVSVG